MMSTSLLVFPFIFFYVYSIPQGYFLLDPSQNQLLPEAVLTCIWKTPITINSTVSDIPMVLASRVSKSDGSADRDGIRNIQIGKIVGNALSNFYAFLYPNVKGDPVDQINNMTSALNYADLGYTTFDDTIWIVVEPIYFTTDQVANQQYLLKLVHALQQIINFPGIYTSKAYWDQVVGPNFNSSVFDNGFNYLFLWWSDLNGNLNNTGYVPFGGWTRPQYHKYAINQKYCGSTFDLSWADLTDCGKNGCMRSDRIC